VHEYPDSSVSVFLGPHRLASYDGHGTLLPTRPCWPPLVLWALTGNPFWLKDVWPFTGQSARPNHPGHAPRNRRRGDPVEVTPRQDQRGVDCFGAHVTSAPGRGRRSRPRRRRVIIRSTPDRTPLVAVGIGPMHCRSCTCSKRSAPRFPWHSNRFRECEDGFSRASWQPGEHRRDCHSRRDVR
jgi:hypothetical protein